MNNTLSELSKPVAWLAIYHGEVYDDAISITRSVVEAQADRFGWESALTEITPLYSQEYVSALDKTAQFWIGESAGWKKRAEDAEKRIAELEAQVKVWESAATKHLERAEEAEKRLATPVRLPKRWDVTGQVNPPRIVEVQFEQQNRTHDQCAEAIRAAGFTVEGDA
ncbi:hypothetical protein [Serratia marcescens]|uniref:hypothetical protein n=1 Tax=Serratia marcescens TaxID=615 RepID=UPI00148CFC83|nr:hypothetical protein [Serratia marcescens]